VIRSFNEERVTDVSVMLRKCRERAGISMGELGRRSKVTTSYVSHIESGEKTPSVDVLFRLVEACGGELKFEVTFKGGK
jgi:transcriptional regulator with XRE-family HTH domain